MKKSVLAMMLGMLLTWTAACGNAASSAGANVDTLTPVQVSVSTDPATLHSHQAVKIQAKVTQGSGNVDDAEEVKFQVWEDRRFAAPARQTQMLDYVMPEIKGEGLPE